MDLKNWLVLLLLILLSKIMAKGYNLHEIKQRLVDILKNSDAGMSGVEISEKTGINRITITKYLKILSTEGFIHEKNIGNVTLWYIDKEIENLDFPSDYHKVQTKFLELLQSNDEYQSLQLFRNCIFSGASGTKLMQEVIIPAISNMENQYNDGKIGSAEKSFQNSIILKTIQMLYLNPVTIKSEINCILISTNFHSNLLSEAVSAFLHSKGWTTFSLSEISPSTDVLLDIDLQKFMSKIWKQYKKSKIVLVFSDSEEDLIFFTNVINSIRKKSIRGIKLGLYGKINKKTKLDVDSHTNEIETLFRWLDSMDI